MSNGTEVNENTKIMGSFETVKGEQMQSGRKTEDE